MSAKEEIIKIMGQLTEEDLILFYDQLKLLLAEEPARRPQLVEYLLSQL